MRRAQLSDTEPGLYHGRFQVAKHCKKRTPKLHFSALRGIGWHVTYRDPSSGIPKKHRFGIREKDREPEARVAYHRWLAEFLENGPSKPQPKSVPNDTGSDKRSSKLAPKQTVVPGRVVHVASGYLAALEARVRDHNESRRQGTISKAVYMDRRKHVRDFLEYLNEQHGERMAFRMAISDLNLADVEGYNLWAVAKKYSSSQVYLRNGRIVEKRRAAKGH